MRLLKNKYTLGELAKILRISNRTITDYRKNGIISADAYRRGHPVYVSRDEIMRVLGIKKPMQEFELLKPKEMAARLGVCENSIYRFHEKEPLRLRLVKLGGLRRAFAEDAKNFPHYD